MLDFFTVVESIPGFMGGNQPRVLFDLFSSYNNENAIGVEVGCLHGRSSYIIAKAICKGKLCCIDPWKGDLTSTNVRSTLKNFLKYTRDCNNIVPVQGYSPEVVKDWGVMIDFLFLDAAHVNPSDIDNINFFLPKIKSGGIISGHDYHATPMVGAKWNDVRTNVQYLENKLKQKVTNPEGTSIWYFKV